MSQALRASKVMGLCAIVFGLIAFSASLAQAEPGAHWNINGAQLTSPLLPEIQVTELEKLKIKLEGKEEEKALGILLTTVNLTPIEILCTSITFVDALLHELGRVTGKILFSGCTLDINKKHAPECVPMSAGEPNGSIETNKLEGLLKLHKLEPSGTKDDLLELLPETPKEKSELPFVSILFGASCGIGNNFDITGTVFLKDCKNLGLVEEKEHLIEEEKTLTKLFFGTKSAFLDGSAKVGLAGAAHAGLKWSGIAA
jgi:hypothetical protein